MTTQNNIETSPAQNDGPCPTCGSTILLGRMRHHKTWCHGQATPEPYSALPAVTVEPLRKPETLLTVLQNLIDECQASRKYIVLSDDGGFAAYNATAKAINRARKAIASAV